jgi:hypothetical protein
MTLLLLLTLPLVACGEDASTSLDDGAGEEPPTPPPLEGVDATHLVQSFPQVPVKEGEFWVRPGSVSNLVKKQQPEPVEKPSSESAAPPAPPSAAAREVAEAPLDTAGNQDAANEQLAAEYAVPSTPPPDTEIPRDTQKRGQKVTTPQRPSAAIKPAPTATKPAPTAIKPAPTATKPAPTATKPAPTATKPASTEAASNHLSVEKAALATKIENRQPIGVSDSFAEGTRVYLFNTILNPDGKTILIHHKWYRDEERVTSIKLSIKAARWRTWSVIPVYGKGRWRVDIVEPSGRVIHTERFTVN